MKKTLLTALAAMVIFAGCTQKPKETTVLKWGTGYSQFPEYLNGKVKEVTYTAYWAVAKDGKVEKGPKLTMKNYQDSGYMTPFHAIFDDSGKLIRCDYLDDNQKVTWCIANDFKDGRVEKENWIRNDTVFANSYFSYNDEGLIDSIRMVNALADSSNGYILLTPDKNGFFSKAEVLNSKGILTNITKCETTPEGRVTKLEFYFPNNDTLMSQNEFTYNDHGFFATQKALDKKKSVVFNVSGEYTYDDKGNWVRTVWTKNGKPWTIDERTYIYY